jgi:hypothetical protein
MREGSSLKDTGREIAANLAMTIAGIATATGISVGAAITTVTRVGIATATGIATASSPRPAEHARILQGKEAFPPAIGS